MVLPQWLEKIDKNVFVFINRDTAQGWLDPFMMAMRNPLTWIPLYAFMLYYVIKKAKSKALQFIVVSGLTVALTDSIAARILKPFFARVRPCADEQLHDTVRSLVGCGGIYSFPSNHAANHFGLAVCWFFSIYAITGKKWHWLWLWALLICYAQIYVGKHFPLDILGGIVLGWVIGYAGSVVFNRWAYPNIHSES